MATIILPGGSGYLGSALAQRLVDRGDEVVVLTRRAVGSERPRVRQVHWDGATVGDWARELDGADAIVHLAGKRVDCRPTRRNIDELIRSRVQSVRAVGDALARCERPPTTWVQLSTMAVYGDAGDQVIDESVPPSGIGPRQMVTVALAWEAAYHQATAQVDRSVLLRAGIALGGDDDPATARLRQLVRLRAGGPVAGGGQWVSWLALDDLLRIIQRSLDDPATRGTYLATSPNPVTNRQMMATYRRLLDVDLGLPAPAVATRLGAWAMGSDPALALTGRRGIPARLLDHGFQFHTTDFEQAAATALHGAASTNATGGTEVDR